MQLKEVEKSDIVKKTLETLKKKKDPEEEVRERAENS